MSQSKVQKRASRLQALLDDRENLNRRIREARESVYSDLGRAVYDIVHDTKSPTDCLMTLHEIYKQECGDDMPIGDRPKEVQEALAEIIRARESSLFAIYGRDDDDESKSDGFGFEASSGDSGENSGEVSYEGQHRADW